ncbi:nucleotide-diphospho-sugar transferase [Irpex lacteus]|nr:nucleotide-diphospho-sugar transferase [Irpex lacteus]
MEADTNGYAFTATQDWFTFNIDSWRALFPLVSSTKPRALEIGSWEGRSAVFLLNEFSGDSGSITCIDHFDLFQTEAGRERHRKVHHNLQLTGKIFRVMPSFSVPALMTLLREEMSKDAAEPGFDWIYLVWRLARQGAIIVFDDYHWNKEPEASVHHPKRGLTHDGDAHWVPRRRVETSDTHDSAAFGYDIHVALVADSAFAMPAAVAISSAMKHTPSRTTFYLLDVGLSAKRCDSGVFDDADGSLVIDKGAEWAKLALLQLVPVERVLYLDADILVRHDLRKPLGAAVDIGHPWATPVLHVENQDVLNVVFRGQWRALAPVWNAQGLGTYADSPSPERAVLDLEESKNDPTIVHFTGPVNPSVAKALNPYVQPCTAKPWGYAEAPGHPFREEWWSALEETLWKGYRSSEAYALYKAAMREHVVKAAAEP